MDQQAITRTKSFPTTTIIYLLLLFQIGIVTSVAENFYNPDYEEEIDQNKVTGGLKNLGQNGFYNDNLSESHHLDTLEDELKEEKSVKRHLGSLRSNQKNELSPREFQLLKRHLGSFAALSGLKQRQASSSPQLFKRYVGSIIASKSGRSPISAVGRTSYPDSSDSQWFDKDKRHLGAFTKTNSKPFNRIVKSDRMSDFAEQYGTSQENDDEQFFDYPSTSNSVVPSDIETYESTDGEFEPVTVKSKRFLGSLARVGWFPRQFRGIIADNPYEKRHIGSAARLGWLPISKQDRFDGEGTGFKRNIQSLKKVHFAVPRIWGRQKRMAM